MKLAAFIVLSAGVLAVGACREQPPHEAPTGPEESEQHAAGSEDFVRRLGEAFRDADVEALDDLFSSKALFAELERKGLVTFRPTDEFVRIGARTGLKQGLAETLRSNAQLMAFEDDVRILRVEEPAEGERVVDFRGSNAATSASIPWRYWLVREADGAWRAYDYQNLDHGSRLTVLMGGVLASSLYSAPRWLDELQELTRAQQSLATTADPHAALERMVPPAEALLDKEPPPAIESHARLMLAMAHQASGDWSAVLSEVERAEQTGGDAPIMDLLRARALMDVGRSDEALAAFDRYAETVGWTVDLHVEVGNVHLLDEDRQAAAAHAEDGLALDPDAYGCLSILALAVPDDERSEVIERVRALDDPETGYAWILEFAKTKEETDAYATYRAALAEDHPDSTWLETYE